MGTLFAVTVGNALMHFHEIDIVEQYSKFIVLYKRFIDDIFSIRASPGIPTQNFWMLLIKKNDRIKLVHCISDRSISFLIFVYIGIIPQACCSFLPFKSLLTNIYTYPSSRFIPLATKRLL